MLHKNDELPGRTLLFTGAQHTQLTPHWICKSPARTLHRQCHLALCSQCRRYMQSGHCCLLLTANAPDSQCIEWLLYSMCTSPCCNLQFLMIQQSPCTCPRHTQCMSCSQPLRSLCCNDMWLKHCLLEVTVDSSGMYYTNCLQCSTGMSKCRNPHTWLACQMPCASLHSKQCSLCSWHLSSLGCICTCPTWSCLQMRASFTGTPGVLILR